MFIDIIVFILLLMAAFKGFRKGLIVAVFSLLSFIVGLAAALKLSAVAADYIGSNLTISQRWLPVIAFIAVFLIVAFLVRLGAKFLEGAVRLALLGWVNRLGGILFFVLIYLFVFSIVLFYANQLHLINPDTVQASATYSYLQPLAPKIIAGLGVVVPFFKNMFTELQAFFGKLSTKI